MKPQKQFAIISYGKGLCMMDKEDFRFKDHVVVSEGSLTKEKAKDPDNGFTYNIFCSTDGKKYRVYRADYSAKLHSQ